VRAHSPLGLFSLLWAAAAALHHLEARPLAGLPLYPFVVLLLVFPGRLWAISVFALAHATLLALDLPSAANHSVLGLLVDGLLLIGCAQAAAGGGDLGPQRLWSALRGPVRATTAVVYFFAIFHKLNSSFFDPEVSCATTQLAKIVPARGFALASYQDDLARVGFVRRTKPPEWPLRVRLRGGDRWVRRNSRWVSELPGVRVPFTEVRRTLQLWREIGFSAVSIGYERGGAWRMVEDAFADEELMRPMPLWERTLMAFRAVDDDGVPSSCRW
jgi:hypothetical protein